MRLLEFLLDAALPPRETEAAVRRLGEHGLAERLVPIRNEYGSWPAVSLFPYTDQLVQACIREAKFEGNERAAGLLGRALRDFLLEFLGESAAFEVEPPVVVPVPLSATRRSERGYNQVERVVQSALFGRPNQRLRARLDTNLLRRTRDTRPQTSLSGEERRQNVAGAFTASPCVPHRTYIVIDDVITTGYTMLAACAALRAAGATRLLPLTLAH